MYIMCVWNYFDFEFIPRRSNVCVSAVSNNENTAECEVLSFKKIQASSSEWSLHGINVAMRNVAGQCVCVHVLEQIYWVCFFQTPVSHTESEKRQTSINSTDRILPFHIVDKQSKRYRCATLSDFNLLTSWNAPIQINLSADSSFRFD